VYENVRVLVNVRCSNGFTLIMLNIQNTSECHTGGTRGTARAGHGNFDCWHRHTKREMV